MNPYADDISEDARAEVEDFSAEDYEVIHWQRPKPANDSGFFGTGFFALVLLAVVVGCVLVGLATVARQGRESQIKSGYEYEMSLREQQVITEALRNRE